jgi:di/tricarboxylate transporter
VSDLVDPQVRLFVIIIAAFAVLVTERLRNDVVGVLIVLALWASGVLDAREALAGFSSEPAIVVAAVFVISAALHDTGVSETLGDTIARWSGHGYRRALLVIMPVVSLLSAFTHHVATTAAMLPVTLQVAQERQLSPSKLLMPMSLAASLGTTITVIGAPAFLIASNSLRQSGEAELVIFSIAPIGLVLSALGLVFMLAVGTWLIPERQGSEDASARYRLSEYLTEVELLPGSPLLAKSADALEADRRYQLNVLGWVRGARRMPRLFREGELREGDVLLVRASPEQMLSIRDEPGIELRPVSQYEADGAPEDGKDDDEPGHRLVQAVVAPASDLVGKSISEVDFRTRFGAIVLGLWRQHGWLQQEIAQVRLRAGDVLVVQGDAEALSKMSADRAILMLVPFQADTRLLRKRWLATLIVVAAVGFAVAGAALEMAMLAGAAAMVLTGCVTMGQAYRAIDQRIYVFVAGAIPLGAAMEKTGAAGTIAGWVQGPLDGASPFLALFVLFVAVSILTQFMSDSATTALFAPIAIGVAHGLGGSPTAYAVTVAMAAVASSLTPLGHHGNLIVYGPGGYRFSDFVRVGTPLTLLIGVAVAFMAPMLWSN